MNCSPGYFRPGKGFTSRTVVLCGFLFLTFTAYVACSNPSPTLQSTASPVVATAPELTTPALTAVTPTPSLTPTSQQTFTPDAGPVSPAPTATAKSSAGALVPAPEPTSAPIARMPVIPATTPPPTPAPTPAPEGAPEQAETDALPGSSIADREALATLYDVTDGPNWDNNENWLSSADLGDWYGVTTDADGSVIELDLDGNGLSGEIPPELGNLVNLVTLSFVNVRSLGGEIPPELGNLTNLEVLRIIYNSVSGQIPPELGNLAKLKELTIRKNRLSGEIPPELGGLKDLEVLDLYVNELSGEIPRELGSMTNLRKLDLGHNNLGGEIPPELGRLANLEELLIFMNNLTGEIPAELGDLARLERMDLGGNELSGNLPPELGSLGNLESLNIVANRLSGEIPAELGNLKRVEELMLSNNRLSGEIPPELVSLARIEVLKLTNNQLSGEIPPELGNLHRLLELDLRGNPLGGCIPTSLEIQYYLAEETSLSFCEHSPILGADIGEQEVADFLGPNTGYIDPVLVSLLYAHRAAGAPAGTVRLGIDHVPELLLEPDLDTFIEEGGGKADGEDIWEMPIELVPSVMCRSDVFLVALPDVFLVALVEPDGTPSLEVRSRPYPNLDDPLTDAVIAHQGGMPENQAALYALFVKGSSIAVAITAPDAEAEDIIRAWLAQYDIYAPPNPYSEDRIVQVLLPVSQILPLVQQFPEAFLQAVSKEHGLPMLRSQWAPEILHFEKSVTQRYLDPDSDPALDGPGKGIAPCSPVKGEG